MVSVASRGTTDRIAPRSFLNTLRPGSGTRAKYSPTEVGAVRRGAVRRADVRFIERRFYRLRIFADADPSRADFVLAVQRCGNAFAISGGRESERPLNLAAVEAVVLLELVEHLHVLAAPGKKMPMRNSIQRGTTCKA